MTPFRMLFRTTPFNRNSLGALLGYLRTRRPAHWRLQCVKAETEARSARPGGPECAAYSFTSWMAGAVRDEVSRLRKAWPRTLFLAGGPHASGDPEGSLALGFDYVFVGEGEASLLEFMRTHPEHAGRIIPPGAPVELDEIESLVPEHDLYPPLEVMRGCRHQCRFCQTPSLFASNLRFRSLDSIRHWVRQAARTGLRQIRFLAPDAFAYEAKGPGRLNPDAVHGLLSLVDLHPGMSFYFGSFPSEVRPEHCRPEMLRLVQRFCKNRRIVVGAQSGSDRMLHAMQRGHTTEAIIEACHAIRAYNLLPVVDFMFGMPGEDPADQEATRMFISLLVKKYAVMIRGHAFVPLPGTAWGNQTPVAIDQETLEMLEVLEKRGQAEGDWNKHKEPERLDVISKFSANQ